MHRPQLPLPHGTFAAGDAGRMTGNTSLAHSGKIAERLRWELARTPPVETTVGVFKPIPAISRDLPADLAAALELARSPRLLRHVARWPLPSGVSRIIRVAGGSETAVAYAARISGEDPLFLYAAANFYVENVMWTKNADPYRILGGRPGTSEEEIAENVRWLVRMIRKEHPLADSAANPALQRVYSALRYCTTVTNRGEA